MSRSSQRRDCHERYVSAGLASVLEHLPYGAFRRLGAAIVTAGEVEAEEALEGIDIETERVFPGSGNRYDVVVPLTFPYAPGITSGVEGALVFESKLGAPDPDQLERYAHALQPGARLVSVTRDRVAESSRWISLTWAQLAVALRAFLRMDARGRFADIDLGARPELRVEPPDSYIGRECEQRIEDFLALLSERRLIRSARRVIVVTGQNAAESCAKHGFYVYGARWDAHFNHVVVVHDQRIQFVGTVTGRFDTRESADDMPPASQSALEARYPGHVGPVVTVEAVSDPDVARVLDCRWPANAFVRSHRYFDDLATFAATWRAGG